MFMKQVVEKHGVCLLDLYFLINFHTFLIRVETGGEEEAQKRKTDLSCGSTKIIFL